MKNLQTKNILLTLVAVLIVSFGFGKPATQLKNNFCFPFNHFSLLTSDQGDPLWTVLDSKGEVPQAPHKWFEYKIENSEDTDPDDNVNNTYCHIVNTLFSSVSISNVCPEITDSPSFVIVPLYILFLSWKSFLH